MKWCLIAWVAGTGTLAATVVLPQAVAVFTTFSRLAVVLGN
jgi:hypothetical protein